MTDTATESWSVGRLLEWTAGYFRQRAADSPRLDAEALLAHVLSCRRIDLYTMYDADVSSVDRGRFRELVKRRGEGCPVAYLVGRREFYSLEFEVTPAVLIPRPETEHVVGEALSLAKKSPITSFCDVGVGSGAIAVTMAKWLPEARGLALDVSADALAVARRNAQMHDVETRLEFRESDAFAALRPDETFDMILSNPPYVTDAEMPTLPRDVRDFEPHLALVGGADGLRVLALIVAEAPNRLRDGGYLVVEIGASQEPAARQLLADSPLTLLPTIKDLAGRPRVLIAQKSAAPLIP